jgi:formate-dependent nitrite reductase membrane component NrfD
MTEIDLSRHSPLLDPVLRAWGWEIPVYLFLGGVAAGVMILAPLLAGREGPASRAARWLAFAPAVLVSVGMGALFLDLANRENVLRFYLAFRPSSPMSWGAWVLLLVYPVSLLHALALVDDAALARAAARLPARARRWLERARDLALARREGLRRLSVALGVALGVYTGILLSTLGARALWSSALLGPLFLASGVSTGAAFLMLFRLSEDERHRLARFDLAAIGAEGALLALLLLGLGTSGAAGRAAASLLLGGPFTAAFFTLVAFGGLLLPALLEVLGRRLALPSTRVGPALVLVGGLALRWIIVGAGQA